MTNSICLRCLSRPLAQIEQGVARPALSSLAISSQASYFSTSAPLAANPPKKKGAVVASKKGGQSFAKQGRVGGGKGGARASGGKGPDGGERKALRKRVVLSNTNALEVQDMADFSAAKLPVDPSQLGQVLGLPFETVDALRANEAFKPTQGWKLFRRPATLVRKETIEVSNLLQEAEKEQKSIRRVIYGERGSGKSVLLLQAMAIAHLKNWLVIHIPEAQELIIGHTSYIPNTSGDVTTYIQPQYTAQILGAIGKANYAVLSKLQLSQKHDLPIPVQENISLARFCELGARDPDLAWPFYLAFWKEITGAGRPPICFAVDGVNHIMKESAYLDADLSKVHSHDLAIVQHFNALLSGKQSLANGGLVLAADAGSNRPAVPAFDFAISKTQAAQDSKDAPTWDPYVQVDRRVLDVMQNVPVTRLEGLSRDEAKGIMEYYAKSGMLRSTVNDRLLGEKWTLSGGGIIGAFEKASVMLRV
ncbi:hypothetical protein AAFC00_007239 [Neodothiora populina]|uniref:Small ribosomal subunit protein mS29 n=1 Tax=Neodothiora populina TaxID=2781224 RepID=A0ABR3PHV2_9PEZI